MDGFAIAVQLLLGTIALLSLFGALVHIMTTRGGLEGSCCGDIFSPPFKILLVTHEYISRPQL
jgi:hypothetical protein